ncbi:MAG: hypothetical protein CFE21_19290 [Bacteroidetes bacterium B1(2017)]|nr:MAG: hypothetical protein CFE21_21455 [Bacteroidetes bacterium B1(2017)]OYU93753.1 MAG: hypothetical protein CFE21_19290 [Bacteroidetes bacterium B1(2017)]
MKKIKEQLEFRILELEVQQKENLQLLIEDLQEIVENLTPLNLIKNVIADSEISSENIGQNILNDAIGISSGYITKRLMFGSSNNPVKKVMGSMFQFIVAKFVSNQSERIEAIGEVIMRKIGSSFSKDKMVVMDE